MTTISEKTLVILAANEELSISSGSYELTFLKGFSGLQNSNIRVDGKPSKWGPVQSAGGSVYISPIGGSTSVTYALSVYNPASILVQSLGLGDAATHNASDFESAGSVDAHEAEPDPHAVYLTQSEADARYKPIAAPSATNITVSRTASNVTVESDNGTDGVIGAASATEAGVMSADQSTKLSGIAEGARVGPVYLGVVASAAALLTTSAKAGDWATVGNIDYEVVGNPAQASGWRARDSIDAMQSILDAAKAGDAAAKAKLAAFQSSVSRDGMYDSGRHFRFVAGVLRNFNDGGGWRLITPAWSAGHLGLNIDSASSDSIAITINHASINGTNIVAIVATPDETLASAGFTVGTSVGQNSSQIRIQRRTMMADYVSYNGSSWSSQQGVFTPTFSAGMLTLAHSAVDVTQRGAELSITGRGGVLVPMAGSSTATTTQVQFFDWAGTLQTTPTADMKIYVNRGQLTAQVNPNNVHVGTYPGSNIWVWGIAEVN